MQKLAEPLRMMKQPVLEVRAGDILAAFRQTRKIFSLSG
jgi:hypothetical protein